MTKTILITAGPTIEPIDPIRYISNHSTGKMGYSLANECVRRGYNVILVSGPTQLKPPNQCKFIAIKTAKEMHSAVLEHFYKADLIFKVAAVADYHVINPSKMKIKKTKEILTLKLQKNQDILKHLGSIKKPHQILVGFAAETHQGVKYARTKLKEKNLDFICLNVINKKNTGFGSDMNQVTMIASDGRRIDIPKKNKLEVAKIILNTVLNIHLDADSKFDFKSFIKLPLPRFVSKA